MPHAAGKHLMDGEDNATKTKTNNIKFTAVRLDLRHVISGRSSARSQVLVISDRTSGLEVKRMVAEKTGFDERLLPQLELIASMAQSGSKAKFLVADDENPLAIYDNAPESSVTFSLKWKSRRTNVTSSEKTSKKDTQPPNFTQINNEENAEVNFIQKPTEVSLVKSFRQSDDPRRYTKGKLPGSRKEEQAASRANREGQLMGSNAPSSHSLWRSRPHQNECIIHYEPLHPSPQRGIDHYNGSRTVQELRSSASSSFREVQGRQFSEISTSSLGSGKSNDIHESQLGRKASVYHAKSLNLGKTPSSLSNVASISTVGSSRESASNGCNDNRESASNGCTVKSLHPLVLQTEVIPCDRVSKDGRNVMDKVNTASSNQTVFPLDFALENAAQTGEQRESKFSSLPNMEELEERSKGCPERTASSFSLPCMNSSMEGGTNAGRRCLPQLCISEETVEEKRSLLSKKLEKKLKTAGKTKMRRKSRNVHGHLSKPNGNIDDILTAREERVSEDESDRDDCMSVTSWEVAEILAMAEPMAPQDSDYEESAPSPVADSKCPSAFKPCRNSPSDSDADTLDGSSTESEDVSNSFAEFSPIGRDARRMKDAVLEKKHNHVISNNHVSILKPQATSTKTSSVGGDTLTSFRSPNQSSETSSVKVPSLFHLLRNGSFRIRTAILARKQSSAAMTVGHLPFEIFNDVVYVDDVRHRSHLSTGFGVVKAKYVVPVVGESTETPDAWKCIEGSLETGDIIVEVNGRLVLHESVSIIARSCLSRLDNLQLLVARQRTPK